MSSKAAARTIVTLALVAGGSSSALAWGWDRCNCYGPPYGNYEPAPVYAYDSRIPPRWTGNGWAHLPVGAYQPAPPAYVVEAPPRYREDVYVDRYTPPRRRYRPMK